MSNIINIQEPKSRERKHIFLKKRTIGVIVFVVFVAGILSGWFYISYQTTMKETKQAKEQEQAVLSAEALANKGDIKSAASEYDKMINKTEDPYRKGSLIVGKAVLYINSGEYDKALSIAKDAEAVNQNSNVASLIADIYEKKGDKQKAIEYYQKAITLINKKDPLANADTRYYQGLIDKLSSKGK